MDEANEEWIRKSDAVARVTELITNIERQHKETYREVFEAKRKELTEKIKGFACFHKDWTCEECLKQFDKNGCNVNRIVGFVNEVCSQSSEEEDKQ